MDQTLKQRLVGALVLLSAAVIFVPLILDGRDTNESYTDVQIPDEPVVTLDVGEPDMNIAHFEQIKQQVEQQRAAITPTEQSLNEPAKVLPAAKPAKQAAEQTISNIIEQSKTQPAKGTAQLAEAYTIQLGAFSSRENAAKLHKKLIKKDYKAYIQKGSSSKGKVLYRVFVGPEIRKNKATRIANALQKELKSDGIKGIMVVRYAP